MKNLLAVVGPTASGKTQLGVMLAQKLGGEIISADSRQVYLRMDIGTGKDIGEYGQIPYHMIDIVEPGEEFNIFDYQRLAYQCVEDIRKRDALPILVGGSGLYLDSLLGGYRLVPVPQNQELREQLAKLSMEELNQRLKVARPVQHNVTDQLDQERLIRAIEIAEGEKPLLDRLPPPPSIDALLLGIRWERAVLRQRITLRLEQRLKEGMIEEVEGLLASGVSAERLLFYGLEYRYICQMLHGQIDHKTMFDKLNQAIHKFAKRQDTWFRRMVKRGADIIWLDGGKGLDSSVLQVVADISFATGKKNL
ncbi:MAG: tRNA (adenosine(37)-N6)-dimethylallyltransferase MiaA [Magnetococcales bacterium]|nr:tRNA (adenosine(37)-N6)-dimethylallyltransferase MiaA [Magnetococcales bacterium]